MLMQNNIEIKKLATEKLNNEPLETQFRFSEFEHIKMLEFINEKIRKTKLKPLIITTIILSIIIIIVMSIAYLLLSKRFCIILISIFTILFLLDIYQFKKFKRLFKTIDKSSKEIADKIALLWGSDIPDDKIPVKIEFNDIVDDDFTGPRIKVIINDILIPECRVDIQYHNTEWITISDTLDVDTRKDIFFYKIILHLPKEFRERTEKICIQTNIGKEN